MSRLPTVAVVEVDAQARGEPTQRLTVLELGPRFEGCKRHAAVHRPGVEVGEAEPLGDRASDR